jgi:hypothetical protein
MNTNDKNSKPTISRKAKVKALFEKEGAEASWVLARRLKLKDATIRTWLSTWRREEAKAIPKAKVKAVKTPKKVIPSPCRSR